jgi:hypothetical protein
MPSSINTKKYPNITGCQKIMFIIIWKVAGELVRPKNMTMGSNNPSGVRNAAFYSSPSFIWMLLYPHRMSNFVNSVHPASRSITDGIRGDTFQFHLVHLLRGL